MSRHLVFECDGCGHRLEGMERTPPMWRRNVEISDSEANGDRHAIDSYEEMCPACFEGILSITRAWLSERRAAMQTGRAAGKEPQVEMAAVEGAHQ